MTHNNGNKNDPKKAGIAGTALEKSGNKFLVMGQWHSHGEVGLENTHRFLRGLVILPDVPRRSRGKRGVFPDLEGWGGYFPIPPSHDCATAIVIVKKINIVRRFTLNNVNLLTIVKFQEVYIDQCKPPSNSKILLLSRGLHWSM